MRPEILARLRALADSWDAIVHAQGTQTDLLAHEAYAYEKCREDLLALLAEVELAS